MTVSHFISEKEEPAREIMTILRSWVMDLGTHVQEKISNKIPYFYFYGQLCYLSPAVDGVDFGFVKGYELSNDDGLLESKGRKHVRSITFHSVAEVEENEEKIRHVLNEAAILNEYHSKRKKQRTTK
jgi:uncharacterized protein YdeI (YjbR/CyaY-like superfamily)